MLPGTHCLIIIIHCLAYCHVCCPAGVVHQVWCCAISFVVVVAVAEISKAFSGRLRPDFLARCQPQELVENSAANTGPYASNLPPVLSRTTLGPVHLGQVAGACTNPNLEEVKDGRLR
jgi:hypothetical protein